MMDHLTSAELDRQANMIPVEMDTSSVSGNEAIDPGVQDPVDKLTGEIKTLLRRDTKAIVAVGKKLEEAKKALPHGAFLPWVRNKVGISSSSASNYMKTADAVFKFPTLVSLPAATLYKVAAASDDDQAAVAERLKEGHPLTHAEIVQLIQRPNKQKPSTAAPEPVAANTVCPNERLSDPALNAARTIARILGNPAVTRSLLADLVAADPVTFRAALISELAANDDPVQSASDDEGIELSAPQPVADPKAAMVVPLDQDRGEHDAGADVSDRAVVDGSAQAASTIPDRLESNACSSAKVGSGSVDVGSARNPHRVTRRAKNGRYDLFYEQHLLKAGSRNPEMDAARELAKRGLQGCVGTFDESGMHCMTVPIKPRVRPDVAAISGGSTSFDNIVSISSQHDVDGTSIALAGWGKQCVDS